jgi:predicted Zn-dependent protease
VNDDDLRRERRAALEAMVAADPNDAFALYGLAIERKNDEDYEAGELLLRRLLVVDPVHLYGYYQLGEVLLADDRPEDAADVLQEGLERALAAGDAKAAGELQALLDET